MSIISALQDFLCGFPGGKISSVLTDIVGERAPSMALSQYGGGSVSEDITGNRIYINTYDFWAREYTADEISRAKNHDFLDSLFDWLEEKNAADELPDLGEYYAALSVSAQDISLYELDANGRGTYRMKIKLEFTKRRG
ncbi:MAG: hypothetical protein IJC39_05670 [Firmicutes bacterium]|nr:hypothetical protein [Bacillota bacterium]